MIAELIATGLTGALGGAAVLWLLRNWIATRLSASVQHEFDVKLEKLRSDLQTSREKDIEALRAQLQQMLSAQTAVQSAFAQSHLSAQEKRLDAVAIVWKSLLNTRNNLPFVLSFVELYKPSEYQLLFDHKPMQKWLDDLSPQGVQQFARTKDSEVEFARPFAGEYLWSILFALEAVSTRMVILLWKRRVEGTGKPWFEDDIILRVIRSVATSDEFEQFRSMEFGQVTWFRNLIERKFLLAAARIISGQASTDVALEEATRILDAASALKAAERPA